MNLTDELERLAKLREQGALNEQEFMLAKNKLLRENTPLPNYREENDRGSNNSLGTAANRYVSFQMIMAGVGLLIFLIVFFTVWLPHFRRVNSMMNGFPSVPGFNAPGR